MKTAGDEAPDSPAHARLNHVLLIEDSAEDAELLIHALRATNASCKVTVCLCLRDGLEVIGAGGIDLVLLDLGLPDSEGLDGLRQVRFAAGRTPTVVLTGNDDQRVATEALQAGAQDYIVKGQYEPHSLLRAAHHALDRAETIELREAERLKSELLAVVSHEMRTPLTVIRENVSLVLEGALGAVLPAQREFLTSAVANCDRLRTMIADLVDTAAIERGGLPLQRRAFDLIPLLDTLAKEFEPVFSSHGQTLSIELPIRSSAMIFGDPDRLRQAVANLLTNAHKFTAPGGRVRLRGSHSDHEALIQVTDNGVGIPKNALEHVFDRFVQLGREHGPGLKGAGLGLSIVRHLVERHGGAVRAESEPGQGSTFTVTLPLFAEGEELRALLAPFLAKHKDGQGHGAWAGFVRVRSGASPNAGDVIRRLAENLRPQLRNAFDEVTVIERDQTMVVAATGLAGDAPWLHARLVQVLPADASLLEWTLCPVSDAVDLASLSRLQFKPVAA